VCELTKDFREKLATIVAMSADRVKGATLAVEKDGNMGTVQGDQAKGRPKNESKSMTSANLKDPKNDPKNVGLQLQKPGAIKPNTEGLSQEQINTIKKKIDAELSGITKSSLQSPVSTNQPQSQITTPAATYSVNNDSYNPRPAQPLVNELTIGPSGIAQPLARGCIVPVEALVPINSSAHVSAGAPQLVGLLSPGSGAGGYKVTADNSSSGFGIGSSSSYKVKGSACEIGLGLGLQRTGENESCLDVGNRSEIASAAPVCSPLRTDGGTGWGGAGASPAAPSGGRANSAVISVDGAAYKQFVDINLLSSDQISSLDPPSAATASAAVTARTAVAPVAEAAASRDFDGLGQTSRPIAVPNGLNIIVSSGGSGGATSGSGDLQASSPTSCETSQTNQPPTQANSSRIRQRPAERSPSAASVSVSSPNNNNRPEQPGRGVALENKTVAEVNKNKNSAVDITPISSRDNINRTLQISSQDLTPTSSGAADTGLDDRPNWPVSLGGDTAASGLLVEKSDRAGLGLIPDARGKTGISGGSGITNVDDSVDIKSNNLSVYDKSSVGATGAGGNKSASWKPSTDDQPSSNKSASESKVVTHIDSSNVSNLAASRSKVETTIILSSVGGGGIDSSSSTGTTVPPLSSTGASQLQNQNAGSNYRYVEPDDPRVSYNSLEASVIPINSVDYAGSSNQSSDNSSRSSVNSTNLPNSSNTTAGSSAAQRSSPAVRRVTSLFHHRPGDELDDVSINQQELLVCIPL